MKCKCGGRTEVLETIQKPYGTRRRRRCVACTARFSTTELTNADIETHVEERVMQRMSSSGNKVDPEAIAAALAVDRRKAEIKARQDAEDAALADIDESMMFDRFGRRRVF